jgi:uncharacterized protein (TIGR03000 family)
MYSMVLMLAMASASDTPAFGKGCSGCWSSCYGCSGSCSGCWSSCYGCSGSCSGCWSSCHGSCHGSSCHGSSCHGCCGGRFFGMMHKHSSCHGCCGGSCYGSSCHGSCMGSCYGSSCHGSCMGSCYGSSCHGSCMGSCYGCHGGVVVPAAPVVVPAEAPKAEMKKADAAAPAKILVSVPADAKLFVDGVATKATTTERSFVTPELPAGKSFSYTLSVEIVRDGKTLTTSEEITVKAGETTSVKLNPAAATSVAAK